MQGLVDDCSAGAEVMKLVITTVNSHVLPFSEVICQEIQGYPDKRQ